MEESTLRKTLSNLGISENAQKIYLSTLGLGALTLSEIAMLTKLDYDIVKSSIDELSKLDLVKELKAVPPRYEMLPPYKLFVTQLDVFGEILHRFNVNMKSAITTALDTVNQRAGELDQSIRSGLASTLEVLSKQLEEMFREIMVKVIEMASDALQKQANNIMKSVLDVVNQNITSLRNEFEKILSENIEKEVDKIINSFKESKQMMEELYKETVKTEAPALEPLWVVRGLTGISAHIEDMLSRAKSIVLIVTPDPKLIPVEKVLQLEKLVRVQIVSQFNTSNDEHLAIINKLKSRERTFIRTNKRVIVLGSIVDDKEAIFASVPDEMDEERIMGIATTSHEWVMASHDLLAYTWTTSEDV